MDNVFDPNKEWRPIRGYEGIYWISSDGQVRNQDRLKQTWINRRGYVQVALSHEGESRTVSVHRLVADAYCDHPDGCNVVHHQDHNKSNNTSINLSWVTSQSNNTADGEVAKKMDARARKRLKKKKRPVLRITYNHETNHYDTVAFESVSEASKQTGIGYSLIYAICNSTKGKAGHSYWIYL